MRPSSGLTFGGRYQLSSRVAIGGMGEVWQATDLVIGRTVAIKILKDEYLGDPGFLERFRAEARHAALVNHEGIANVFDYGEEDGSAYLVMELVPGEALSAILERERVLSTDRVLDIVAQTAAALQAAHAAGLVHRDIKPGNLLITPDGRVKITDFGIARIADQVPLTATGQVMGTVQYLSPEQASGHPASPSTDIYSLGIVAYESLAGRRPFTGESQVAIAMAQINETPPELPATVADPVRNLVYACLAKNPSDRPASATHLARAAQALRRGDVAAAAAAVPGVLGDGTLAATVGPNYGQNTQATRVMTTQGAVPTPTAPIETPTRNPWTWPLVILISLLALVLIGTIIALVVNPLGDQTAPTSTPPTSAAPTSAAPTSPTPTTSDRVALDPTELEGRTRDVVEARLTELGLILDGRDGTVAPTVEQEGLAYNVTPSGNVRLGETITVSFYSAIPAPPSATKPPAPTASAGPYLPGSVVTFSWPAYSGCPADHPLSGFNVQAMNGTPENSSQPANATSADITISSTVGDSTSVTYTAVCTDFESPLSDAASVTVVTGP
ncbi:serine/threonine-protein kinase [Salinibacterium sp. CAN_S4]|uniref:protein kinase domain-containing protein n=1 Tax=Salinibacterium sp. CAN_S4 TaxID=2787727 RepID=UPI0018EFABEC